MEKEIKINEIFVLAEDSLNSVIRKMDHAQIGMALVLNNTGQLIGVINDHDIRVALLKGADLGDPIRSFYTKDPIIISENNSKNDEEIISSWFGDETLKDRHPSIIPVVNEEGIPVRLVRREEITNKKNFTGRGSKISPRDRGRILVIGGAGYIGSVLVRELLKRGYVVKVLDALLYGQQSLTELRSHPQFELIKGDVRHIENLVFAIQDSSCVIHLAELVGDPLCKQNPELAVQINYLSTLTIARICSYLQVNRMIYISSCSVYGASADPDELLHENSSIAPVSLYARMKLGSERAILNLDSDNFSPCILRLGTVFGVSSRPRFDLVVNTLTAQAIQNKKITLHGGEQWRPHVHVTDVASAIRMVLEAPITKIAGQIFNVAGENLRINELGELISQEIPGVNVAHANEVKDLRNYKVSAEKAKKILGFSPSVTVREGIRELKRYMAQQKDIDSTHKQYHNVHAVSDWVGQ